MRTLHSAGGLAIVGVLVLCGSGMAAISGLHRVASGADGLYSPMFVTYAPGDKTRLFIGERGGTIKILNLTTGQLEPTPFLSIPDVDQAGEGGLLGMTFDPNYASNGKFYVNVTIDNGGLVFQNATSLFSTEIRLYSAPLNPNVADPTPTPVLSFIQPQANHNAGWIGFSPVNGYLYIPTGDGGAGYDDGDGHTPGVGNAQDIEDNFLGKILRIDVNSDEFPGDTPEALAKNYAIPHGANRNPFAKIDPNNPDEPNPVGDDEIWAIGMRNPFRDSFDRDTGDLWLGDVGQGSREEIDRQPANAPGGENFGWRLREGNIETPDIGGPVPPNYRAPVYDYDRTGTFGGKTVIGGYVYRGPDPDLQGKYFFADAGDFGDADSNKFWMFDPSNPAGTVTDIKSLLMPDAGSLRFPSAFGEDAVGNLYIVSLETHEVFRIETDNTFPGDYNIDRNVDDADYNVWKTSFGSNTLLAADGNHDIRVDAADYTLWRDNLGIGVTPIGIPGDYNRNGIVDAADYTVWRDSLGSTTSLTADGNNSGSIDDGDYDVWRTNFGQHAPGAGSGSGANANAAVPEPSMVLLALLGMAGLFTPRWKL